MSSTHEVTNQVPLIAGLDITTHPALVEGLHREGAGWAEAEVRDLGALGNSEAWQERGRLANEHPPVLRTHDRYGHRIDEVEYLPQYHDLMQVAVEHGLHAAPWADERPGAHVARAAQMMVWGVTDAGHLCPISMTYAVGARAAHDAGTRAALRAAADQPHLRLGLRPPRTSTG